MQTGLFPVSAIVSVLPALIDSGTVVAGTSDLPTTATIWQLREVASRLDYCSALSKTVQNLQLVQNTETWLVTRAYESVIALLLHWLAIQFEGGGDDLKPFMTWGRLF